MGEVVTLSVGTTGLSHQTTTHLVQTFLLISLKTCASTKVHIQGWVCLILPGLRMPTLRARDKWTSAEIPNDTVGPVFTEITLLPAGNST